MSKSKMTGLVGQRSGLCKTGAAAFKAPAPLVWVGSAQPTGLGRLIRRDFISSEICEMQSRDRISRLADQALEAWS